MDEKKGIWRHETLNREAGNLITLRSKGTNVDKVAIELCLGREVFITGNSTKQSVAEGQQIAIPSGQMALLLTDERIRIPMNAMGFISMKSTVKLDGLINISGFHVDPGYNGHLVFSVFNAGPRQSDLHRENHCLCCFCAASMSKRLRVTTARGRIWTASPIKWSAGSKVRFLRRPCSWNR